jgi:outer membrane translocation and assembly module TamA
MLDKNDLQQIRTIFKEEVNIEISGTEKTLRGEIQASEQRVRKEVQNSEEKLRGEILNSEKKLIGKILNSENKLRGEIQVSEQRVISETGKFIEDQIITQLEVKADKKDVRQIKKHLGLITD